MEWKNAEIKPELTLEQRQNLRRMKPRDKITEKIKKVRAEDRKRSELKMARLEKEARGGEPEERNKKLREFGITKKNMQRLKLNNLK